MSRTQHPFPRLVRDGWISLDGEWDFEFFSSDSDLSELIPSKKINVPFLPGLTLSGIDTECSNSAYYMRKFKLQRCPSIGHTFLHFGGIRGSAEIFVNGKSVGTHSREDSFIIDVSSSLKCGENRLEITVHGKGAGIFKSVIAESVPDAYIKNLYFERSGGGAAICGTASAAGSIEITVLGGGAAQTSCTAAENGSFSAELKLPSKKEWKYGLGGLYDVIVRFGDDTVITYLGIAESSAEEKCTELPEYPCGGYTAPNDSAQDELIRSLAAQGYNTISADHTLYEDRLVYCADKYGMKIIPCRGLSNVV